MRARSCRLNWHFYRVQISCSETPRLDCLVFNRGFFFSVVEETHILDTGRPVRFGLVKHTGTKSAGQHIAYPGCSGQDRRDE